MKNDTTINEFNQKIGKVIQKKRSKQNLTQKELGDAIGVSTSVISRIEAGKEDMPISYLPKICSICNFNPNELFEDESVKSAVNATMEFAKEILKQKIDDEKKRCIQNEKSRATKLANKNGGEYQPAADWFILDKIPVERIEKYSYASHNQALLYYYFSLQKKNEKEFFNELSSIISVIKTLESKKGNKRLKRDVVKYMADSFILDAAESGSSLAQSLCEEYSKLLKDFK